MKAFTFKIAMILVLSVNFISCAQSSAKKSDAVSLITPQELKVELGDIQLVDVRTPQEYAEGYIPGAKLIDFTSPDFVSKIDKLDKNKDIYIYCRSGHRSGKAAQKLKSLGFTKIHDLKGGILNWNQNNMKVVK